MSDAVLDRVRKLLALATSPNPHEAAAAAARAQALVTAHRLEGLLAAEQAADRAIDTITDGLASPLEVARKIRKWKGVLASVLADVNGCVAWTCRRPDGVALCVVGTDEDREAVRALYEALVPRIEWLSATEGPGRDRAWHEAFRIGAAEVVAERLRSGRDAAHEALDQAALTVVDPARAAHAIALERFVQARLGRGRGRNLRVDADALQAGRAAGARLDPGDR